MRRLALFLSFAILILFMAGCGSQSSVTSPPPSNPAVQTVPVGVTVTDAPPSGVTVLFFQLSITSATLTDSSGGTVSLLGSSTAIPVNVSQLQTDTAFIGSQNVTAGTYASMGLTFANPQLTIFNASDTDPAITSLCAVGKVCELPFTPSTSGTLTMTFNSTNSTAFPVTLSASSPLAFKLDIHLNTVIQNNLSLNLAATNGVTISQVKPPSPQQPISAVGRLMGTVGTPGTNQFPLATPEGRTFTINVNSSTTYSGFPNSACTTQGFSCLASGQTVKVLVTLQTDGTLLATAVGFVQLSTQQTVIGNIIGLSTSGGNTVMDLVSQQPLPTPVAATAVIPIGKHLSVSVPPTNVTFAIDSDGFTIPSGLTFASASDLQVGQTVKVVVVQNSVATPTTSSAGTPGPVGPPDMLLTASSINLEPGPITGKVASVNASAMSFGLATLGAYFVPPTAAGAAPNLNALNIITVQTTADTTFTNVTGVSGLNVNDVVSVGGWVFSTPTGMTKVTVAAKAVIDRGQLTASPLF